jgi:hypothetical protein
MLKSVGGFAFIIGWGSYGFWRGLPYVFHNIVDFRPKFWSSSILVHQRLNVLVASSSSFFFLHVSIIECLPYVLDFSFPTYFLCTFYMWLRVCLRLYLKNRVFKSK